jgi:PAS domain-containing protein
LVGGKDKGFVALVFVINRGQAKGVNPRFVDFYGRNEEEQVAVREFSWLDFLCVYRSFWLSV